jgi:glycosyltransferase involved in cell wall biosynthesis
MACGCTILASNTPPVREVLTDGSNGLLADFFDIEGLAEKAVAVLRDPPAYRELGARSTALINDRYALDVTLPKLIAWLEDNAAVKSS